MRLSENKPLLQVFYFVYHCAVQFSSHDWHWRFLCWFLFPGFLEYFSNDPFYNRFWKLHSSLGLLVHALSFWYTDVSVTELPESSNLHHSLPFLLSFSSKAKLDCVGLVQLDGLCNALSRWVRLWDSEYCPMISTRSDLARVMERFQSVLDKFYECIKENLERKCSVKKKEIHERRFWRNTHHIQTPIRILPSSGSS